jgi:hypothetical protein
MTETAGISIFLTTRGQSIRLCPAVSVAPYDQILTLYRTLLVFATVGVVILSVGLVEFVYFEPPGQTTGATAHIAGVFAYDPKTGSTHGPDRTTFARTEQFAAAVDWSQLPPDIVVDARWFNSFGSAVGAVGPATPAELGPQSTVPVIVPPGLHHSLPGHYTFVVERLKDGRPVEVLGRRIVLVER